ncbi:MAG TPA: ribbon-helix-helix protein, CopG family [Polyangiaceae bacterium]|nr:ribbon-helix-helix protein, CopG family [Polyangiaceae bacterium]
MQWKVRQAQKGKIPVGPRRTRPTDGEAPNFKVLPLRMEAELVTQLDEARERLGLKSRMELFRRSLHTFLLEVGEVRVAEMFAPEA